MKFKEAYFGTLFHIAVLYEAQVIQKLHVQF